MNERTSAFITAQMVVEDKSWQKKKSSLCPVTYFKWRIFVTETTVPNVTVLGHIMYLLHISTLKWQFSSVKTKRKVDTLSSFLSWNKLRSCVWCSATENQRTLSGRAHNSGSWKWWEKGRVVATRRLQRNVENRDSGNPEAFRWILPTGLLLAPFSWWDLEPVVATPQSDKCEAIFTLYIRKLTW